MSRGGGEGGGQAMSVLLSWHEKVRFSVYFIPFVELIGGAADAGTEVQEKPVNKETYLLTSV